MLAKQKSQDTFSLKEKVSSKPVITTQQIADQLNISAKIIFEEAKLIDGEGNDYLAVMFPNATKPSIYINPKTAVPKLMLWKKNNPTKIKE